MEEPRKRRLVVNWRQAAGEALLICLGVGVALLGQAWWEGRVERVVVQQHIDGLLDELRANREGLRKFEDVHNGSLRRAATVLRLLGEPPSSENDDSLVAFAWTLVAHNYFVPATAAMSNLIGAGGLGLIKDPALRLKVTEYAQSVESFNSFAADLSSFQLREMRPALAKILPLANSRWVDMMGSRGIAIPESSIRPDPSSLRTLQFENLVVLRMGYEGDMADEVVILSHEVDELIELLESSR